MTLRPQRDKLTPLSNSMGTLDRLCGPRPEILGHTRAGPTQKFAGYGPGARVVGQWSPSVLEPGTSFLENNFSIDQGGQWFRDDPSALYLLHTLLLFHQLHLRSSGIRSWRLGTHVVREVQ